MADWSRYGLEDFAEVFEQCGIRTEQQLIDAAPQLEEMGLTGLCDAIGVPKNRKKQPAPKPQPPKKQEKGKSKLDKIGRIINIGLIIVVALALLVIVIMAKLT